MAGSRKRRITPFNVAQKAITTSSASTRFKAEDNPEEEDIKADVGSNQPVEDAEAFFDRLREEHGEALVADQRRREGLLIRNVPRAQQAEVLRRYRLQTQRKMLRQREAEQNAPEDIKGSLSPYALEDSAAKRTHSLLSQAFSHEPGDRYLARGGRTYQSLSSGRRETQPLDTQLIGPPPEERGQRRVPSNQADTVADQIASSVAGGDTDLDTIMNRFSEETEAELRPRVEAHLRERGVDVSGGRIGRIEQELAPEQVIFKKEDREKAISLLQERQQLIKLERDIKQKQSVALRDKSPKTDPLKALKQRVQSRRQQVEAQLSDIKPNALVKGETITPEQTEHHVRRQIKEALDVPDPLGRTRSGFAGAARNAADRGQDATQFNEPIRKVATDQQVEEFVKASVASRHAPTHAQRVSAQMKASRLASQMSQQVQKISSHRSELAEQERIKDQMRSEGLLPPPPPLPPPSAESKGVMGVQSFRATRGPRPPGPPPPPGAWGAIPGGPAWVPPPGPHKDPRLNDLTVEDVYEAYGHEQAAPRLKWEKDRLKAKFHDEPFNQSKPAPFKSITQQGKFIKNQTQARVRGFVQGTEILGVTPDRKTTPYTSGSSYRAAVGVTPNVLYQYKLRNPKTATDEAQSRQAYLETLQQLPIPTERAAKVEHLARIERQRRSVEELTGPVSKNVAPEDTKTQFHVATRDRFGRILYPDDYDEIVSPVTTRKRQTKTFGFSQGAMQPKTGKERLPEGIDEVRYLAVPGATGQITRTISDPSGEKRLKYLVAARGGREVEVTRAEYEAHERDVNDAQREGRNAPVNIRTEPVPRKIQYRLMDPAKLELAGTRERDTARIRIPKVGPLNERLLHVQFSDDDQSRLNQLVGKPTRKYAEIKRLEAAQKIAEPSPSVNPELHERYTKQLMERHGITDTKEAHLLAGAAAAAGFYTAKERFTKGQLPYRTNKLVERIPGSDKYNVGFAVNESLIRPGIERVANIPYMIQHPLSNPSGGLSGLEVSSWRYRQEGIRKQTFARRSLERQTNQLKRIQTTANFVEKYKEQRGPVGAYTRWRLGPLSRSSGYKLGQQEGLLHDVATTARRATGEDSISYYRNKTNRMEPIEFGPLPGQRGTREDLLRSRTRRSASELQGQYNLTKRSLERNPFSPALRGSGPGFVHRGFSNPGMERSVLLGSAAVGTAAGAAYLYHQHQQHKKPEDERVAFYNKILPPTFTTPKVFPKGRVTKVVRFGDEGPARELGLSGKELPIQFGLKLHDKRIALRPSERGYHPDLPLVGRPSFKGTAGGSSRKGLTYYPTTSRGVGDIGKRTTIRRSTHEVRVAGKKLPGALNVGPLRPINLQTRNPNRMTTQDRENIIWSHAGTDLEEHVKNFYRGAGGDRAQQLLEQWDNPDEVARIRRQKGRQSREYRQFERAAVRQRQRVG